MSKAAGGEVKPSREVQDRLVDAPSPSQEPPLVPENSFLVLDRCPILSLRRSSLAKSMTIHINIYIHIYYNFLTILSSKSLLLPFVT